MRLMQDMAHQMIVVYEMHPARHVQLGLLNTVKRVTLQSEQFLAFQITLFEYVTLGILDLLQIVLNQHAMMNAIPAL
jgi:hypothetical protein